MCSKNGVHDKVNDGDRYKISILKDGQIIPFECASDTVVYNIAYITFVEKF